MPELLRDHSNNKQDQQQSMLRTAVIRPLSILITLSAALALHGAPAAAQGLRPSGAFLQAGSGDKSAQSAEVGLLWPWAWRHAAWGGAWTAQTELVLGQWRLKDAAEIEQSYTHLALVPMFRFRGAGGQSPWFIEAGIGASYNNKLVEKGDKQLSTRWNFSDNVAVGRSFGAQQQHELSLRLQHTSNAGIKNPNPGLNLVMLRYAARF
jgi:hypothetical protein